MPIDVSVPVEPKPAIEIEVRDFGKAAAGFTFNVIQFNDLEVAIKKYGEEIVLDLFNSAIANALRAKAKASLPVFDDKNATQAAWSNLLREGKNCLITAEQAENFVPGVRAQSPAALLKKAKEAKKAGNSELAKQFLKQAMALLEDEAGDL